MRTLFMSGYPDDGGVSLGLGDDETSFLQKPFTTEGLARAVRDLLDSSAAVAA
jgi:hypothetical protein